MPDLASELLAMRADLVRTAGRGVAVSAVDLAASLRLAESRRRDGRGPPPPLSHPIGGRMFTPPPPK